MTVTLLFLGAVIIVLVAVVGLLVHFAPDAPSAYQPPADDSGWHPHGDDDA